MVGDLACDHLNDIISGAGARGANHERLANVLTDDVAQLAPAPVSRLIELKVDHPHPVHLRGP